MKTYLLYTRVFIANLLRHFFKRKPREWGLFIEIDGGEGAGKDTVIEKLKVKYPNIEFSREPGGTPMAEDVRSVMLGPKGKGANGATHLLLVNAGRSDHMHRKAEEVIMSGRHFITNRGGITTWGYQIGGQEGGYPLKRLLFEVRKVIYSKVWPDLYIVLEVDPKEGTRRVKERNGEVNHFDERDSGFHERVMRAYRLFGKLFPFEVRFVDANKSREEVYAAVESIVEEAISKKR